MLAEKTEWRDARCVQILPGFGVELAKIGEARGDVEDRIGRPVDGKPSTKDVYATTPRLVISWTPEDTVEIVEIGHGDGEREAYLDDVQLTFDFLDHVVAELTARGYTSTRSDIGFVFHAGFSLWSMRSREARALDPDADEDDERAVSEGVSVAPYEYFVS
jgi:hypothetical protein